MALELVCGRAFAYRFAIALALVLAVGTALTTPAHAGGKCTAPHSLLAGVAPLQRVALRLSNQETLRIVALGSSSTSGHGATSPKNAYPALLQERLTRMFPASEIGVHNGGVNGQLAADMVDRLYRDAIALEPDLVIWQTGTNDALSRVELDDFYSDLSEGLDRLAEAGIDVVLIDPQFFPGVKNASAYEGYVQVMRAVADDRGVALLPRYAIMRDWALSKRYGETMLAADRFHLSDRGYSCLAELLADVIARGAGRP